MNLTFFSINVHWRRKSHLISRKDSSLSQVYASCQQVKQVQHVNIHSQKLNPAILPVTWLFFIWHRDKRPRTSYFSIKDMFISSSCWESIFLCPKSGQNFLSWKDFEYQSKSLLFDKKAPNYQHVQQGKRGIWKQLNRCIKVTRERVISPKFTL